MKNDERFTYVDRFDRLGNTYTFSTINMDGRFGAFGYYLEEARGNYETLASVHGVEIENIYRVNQKHTATIVRIDEATVAEGVVRPLPALEADGMITNVPGRILSVLTADCVPVFLYDPVKAAIGIVHSGWRGTALKITVNAINRMIEEYGTATENLLVHIGPCICGDCYEVGEELRDDFLRNYTIAEVEKMFVPATGDTAKSGKYMLNLEAAIRMSLMGLIPDTNISSDGRCTKETGELCSYRRTHELRDHILSGIMLRKTSVRTC